MGTYGENGPLVVYNHVHNPCQGTADAVIRGAFPLDDVVGSVSHLFIDVIPGLVVERAVLLVAEVIQGHASHPDCGPGKHLGITVLADDVAMDMLRVNA